jgi:ferredoxin
MKMYDDRTARFDSPFQTGNCGGDGTCGTCVVAVLSGDKFLNGRKRVEDQALSQQVCPPNYRWACRVNIADDPDMEGEVVIKLRPQTTVLDA